MAQNKKMYDNKATVIKYSGPKHVLTKRPFFQLVQRIFTCNVCYSPMKAVTITCAIKGGPLNSRGFGNSLSIGPIRIWHCC